MNKEDLKNTEKEALIRIRRGECRSRADVARALGISRPTASLIAEKLIEINALCENGRGKSLRGKSPTILSPVPDYQYTIGLDLGYTSKLVGIVIDGKNEIVRTEDRCFDSSSMASIQENVLSITASLSEKYPVSGIGVALSGIVSPESGRVTRSINPLFAENDIGGLVSEWTALPAAVDNRARSAAFSEAFGGAADKEENFILLSLGKSIGAAFWLNKKIFHGSHGTAGEIRSMRLTDGRTLEEALSRELAAKYTKQELVAVCTEGIRQLTEIMDIEFLILAGRFNDFGPRFPGELRKQLSKFRKYRIEFSKYGCFSAARGSAVKMAELQL